MYIYIYIFRESGRGRKREEKHQCGGETLLSCLLHTPRLRPKPATQACA